MATLSAISKFLACYTWGRKGEGQEWGGRVSQAGTILFFTNTHLEWCEQPE